MAHDAIHRSVIPSDRQLNYKVGQVAVILYAFSSYQKQATSSNYPLVWSFLTCYHFGYHWEHHEYPSLPLYRLPAVRQSQLQKQPIKIGIGKPLVLRLATTSPLFTLLLMAC